MSIPTMIGFSFQMIYDLVDLFWIGKISSDAIAGVTIFTTIFWVVEALNEIIGVSSISLISQAYGKNDRLKTNKAIEQTITFKFIVAIIAAVLLSIFLKPFMNFFGTAKVVNYGLEYGYIRLFFLPIMFSSFSVNTALRCIGDAKTPMKIMIFASIINIFLDPFLIFEKVPVLNINGLNYGIKGAAIATIISQSVAFFIGMYIIFSGKEGIQPKLRNLFKLNWMIDKKLITIGLPNGIQVFLRNLSHAVILKYVSLFSSTAIAAFGIGGRIFGFAFMPLIGFSMGGSAIVGQSLGDENVKRAKKTGFMAGFILMVVMLIFSIFVIFFGKEVIGIFSSNSDVIMLGAQFLKFGTIGLVFIGFGYGLATVFSGSGYNIPFLISTTISRWLIQIPVLFMAVNLLNLSIIWVWLSFLFGDIVELIVFSIFFRDKRWKNKRV
ncbi:MAG: MATE family efflux transporter [Candidatus Mcinerneyibacterium aminivorans]|uniref:Multidrug-efflux transporter n=1 Tax=Candidatus Mcinerneyibacterium aminivorans TaxID=2703815 RepID=A0A5D0MK33_9BACT|nr:MAG: MATE family efflux transporter [Candidatus Mcinerneyibacterium aminivorans]